MPAGEPNLFGLHQFDNQTSFFNGKTVFSPVSITLSVFFFCLGCLVLLIIIFLLMEIIIFLHVCTCICLYCHILGWSSQTIGEHMDEEEPLITGCMCAPLQGFIFPISLCDPWVSHIQHWRVKAIIKWLECIMWQQHYLFLFTLCVGCLC